MQIIKKCHIGVGEFYSEKKMIWGGTGWEVLASGRPLLQGFDMNKNEFISQFGYPPPPMLKVNSPECIFKHLLSINNDPTIVDNIGKDALEWFNKHNGIELAKKWLNILFS